MARRVEWGDTDAAGIVFYPNFFRWFDGATHNLFEVAGYSVSQMMDDGYTIPLIDAGSRFITPLLYADEIVINSTLVELRSRSFRIQHRVERAGKLIAEGYEVRMWTRVAGGEIHAEAMPAHVQRLLNAGAG